MTRIIEVDNTRTPAQLEDAIFAQANTDYQAWWRQHPDGWAGPDCSAPRKPISQERLTALGTTARAKGRPLTQNEIADVMKTVQ